MIEGWLEDVYLVLFSEAEIDDVSSRYDIERSLPGYVVLGLWGWDDLVVRDHSGNVYTIPTVPLDQRYLQKAEVPETLNLEPDARFKGKIKWYVKPLAFGGDPGAKENLVWVTHKEHSQLVAWWNKKYLALNRQDS
ncbi:MAG: hypothetical protein KJ060_14530 [Candidatus Hydrogenedentes bacterium]|nr:hypothetical protein [Candidatus Hydrogenedentota bacterium]